MPIFALESKTYFCGYKVADLPIIIDYSKIEQIESKAIEILTLKPQDPKADSSKFKKIKRCRGVCLVWFDSICHSDEGGIP